VTLLAISNALAGAAWFGLAVGLGLAVVVLVLLQSVLRPAREIRRYAEDVLETAVRTAANLEAVEQLEHTRQLAQATPGLAARLLDAHSGGRP
jgi:hypothetical protein